MGYQIGKLAAGCAPENHGTAEGLLGWTCRRTTDEQSRDLTEFTLMLKLEYTNFLETLAAAMLRAEQGTYKTITPDALDADLTILIVILVSLSSSNTVSMSLITSRNILLLPVVHDVQHHTVLTNRSALYLLQPSNRRIEFLRERPVIPFGGTGYRRHLLCLSRGLPSRVSRVGGKPKHFA